MAEIAKKLYELALGAQSADEIAGIAEGAGIELANGDAERLFERLHGEGGGEIADEELDNVAGGGCKESNTVRPGTDGCKHGFGICKCSCLYFKPREGTLSVGECTNPNPIL